MFIVAPDHPNTNQKEAVISFPILTFAQDQRRGPNSPTAMLDQLNPFSMGAILSR